MAHSSPCAVPTCRTDVAPWVFIGGSQDPPGIMGTGVGKVPGWGLAEFITVFPPDRVYYCLYRALQATQLQRALEMLEFAKGAIFLVCHVFFFFCPDASRGDI